MCPATSELVPFEARGFDSLSWHLGLTLQSPHADLVGGPVASGRRRASGDRVGWSLARRRPGGAGLRAPRAHHRAEAFGGLARAERAKPLRPSSGSGT